MTAALELIRPPLATGAVPDVLPVSRPGVIGAAFIKRRPAVSADDPPPPRPGGRGQPGHRARVGERHLPAVLRGLPAAPPAGRGVRGGRRMRRGGCRGTGARVAVRSADRRHARRVRGLRRSPAHRRTRPARGPGSRAPPLGPDRHHPGQVPQRRRPGPAPGTSRCSSHHRPGAAPAAPGRPGPSLPSSVPPSSPSRSADGGGQRQERFTSAPAQQRGPAAAQPSLDAQQALGPASRTVLDHQAPLGPPPGHPAGAKNSPRRLPCPTPEQEAHPHE